MARPRHARPIGGPLLALSLSRECTCCLSGMKDGEGSGMESSFHVADLIRRSGAGGLQQELARDCKHFGEVY